MFEHRYTRPIPRAAFLRRLAQHAGFAGLVIVASLGAGMLGYHAYEGLGWVDAFLNASMLLGGMGPVESPRTDGGKLFAGFYALYCGIVFLVIVGIIFAPVVHRLMHRFHWEAQERGGKNK